MSWDRFLVRAQCPAEHAFARLMLRDPSRRLGEPTEGADLPLAADALADSANGVEHVWAETDVELRSLAMATRLSPHFLLAEFRTHDGTAVPADLVDDYRRLCVRVLEPLRERFGRCTVVSGYRHPRYNLAIGGARRSVHMGGRGGGIAGVAADVKFDRGRPNQWAAAAEPLLGHYYPPGGGLGTYEQPGGWIHVDTRSYRARWSGAG